MLEQINDWVKFLKLYRNQKNKMVLIGMIIQAMGALIASFGLTIFVIGSVIYLFYK